MEFIVNDCSLHEQFQSPASFIEALKRLLALRSRVERSGRVVRCPRSLLDARIGPTGTLRQALATVPDRNLRAVVVTWLAQKGPFWDDAPLHGPGDWFESKSGDIVTQAGLGEAAMGALRGQPRATVSFDPSSWTYTPIEVRQVLDDATRRDVSLENHWDLPTIERRLRETRPPLACWQDLLTWARDECPRLTFTDDVIRWLDGYPFIPGAAERFQVLLSVLDTLKGSFDPEGGFTREGMRLYQDHFTGEKAWFTDSSDSEKNDFRDELTFSDPEIPGARLLCPWHGKVKIEQMRMHFTFPIRHDRPLYIVYIGPKLTRR